MIQPQGEQLSPGWVSQPCWLWMASKGLLHCQHPLGIPSDHITSVINSIIGFSFAETARSRWAPSAPCIGPGCSGRGQSPSFQRIVSFLPTGDKDKAVLGAAAAPGQWLWVQLPNSPAHQPRPSWHPSAPDPAPPGPSASLNCLRGFASLCLISLRCK